MRLSSSLAVVTSLVLGTAPLPSHAADYPNRLIRVIVPYSPGGTMDIIARVVMKRVSEAWGQQIIIENRPGAGGSIGAETVARAAPDGYTLLAVTNAPLTVNPVLNKSLRYSWEDFEPIAVLSDGPLCIAVNPKLPISNIAELISYAKAHPTTMSASSPGTGTIGHISIAVLNKMAGIDIAHIPFNGVAPALAAIASGDVQAGVIDYQVARGMIDGGQVRTIASTGARRGVCGSQVPTVAEQGLPNYKLFGWHTVLAPKDTPENVVTSWSTEINRVLADADVRRQLSDAGVVPRESSSPQESAAFLREEVRRWATFLNDAGLKRE
jgi:tripartite-type tricarboxylate transporter receptor subunit TctC